MALIDDSIFPDNTVEEPATAPVVLAPPVVPDSSYAAQMMQIANNDIREMDIGSAEQAKNQISMFLVSQAKNELYRIIKLTSFLETVEAKYIDTATELMQQFPDNLSLVQNVLETIEKSITRSNELLTQVLKDEKLNTYVFNFHASDSEDTNAYKNLSKASRDDIRNFANSMLDQLNKVSNTSESEGSSEDSGVDSDKETTDESN